MNPNLRPIAFQWHGKLDDFITAVAWSPEGERLAAASVSGQIAIYDVAGGKVIHLIEQAHADGCDALAWRPDGKAVATAGRDGTWKLWNAAEGQMLVEHEAGALWAEHLAWSSKPIGDLGHLLAVGVGNKVTLWNEKGEASVVAVDFRATGSGILAEEGTVTRSATATHEIKLPKTVVEIAWILGGTTLAVATSTAVSLYDPLTAKQERIFHARDPILAMAFSPSGKWLMTGNQDCTMHVWNSDNGAEMHMRGYAAKVRQMAWHRHSRWLAVGGGDAVSVWDCAGKGPEGRQPTILEWHTDQVSALHYQPQGDWLASGARDGGVAVWSPTQRQTLISGAKIPSGVTRVAWSPDGKLLAATGESGEVHVLAVE